jgi:hypothetical protein
VDGQQNRGRGDDRERDDESFEDGRPSQHRTVGLRCFR